MKNEISIYNFNQNQIRTQLIDGNPWFCHADCCHVLGLKNGRMSSVKDVKKIYTPTNGGNQELTFINEPNLYRLIFRSNKPNAQAFANWVYSEVLPTIRKTGAYISTVHSDLGLVPVKPHIRRLPSVKKEIVLSETEHKAIGGIVKKCVAVAVKETLGSFLSPQEPLIAELKPNDKLTKAERKLAEAVVEFGQEKERHGKIKGLLEGAFNSQLVEIAKQAEQI